MQHLKVLFLFMCVSVSAWGQKHLFSASVVDASTGEPLPYVNVYIADGRGTMTNANGDFTVETEATENLRLSYVGYETQNILSKDLPRVVKMKELAVAGNEVTVLSDVAILEEVAKKLSKDYGKYAKKNSPYFNRITATYGGMTEMVEDFIEAHSAVNLRKIRISTGQYWGKSVGGGKMQSSLTHSNLHKMMSLAPMVRDEDTWADYILPFPIGCKASYFGKHYLVCKETLTGDDGRLMYRFNLRNKQPDQPKSMSGMLYVDADTYGLLRFDGMVHGVPVALDVSDEELQKALVDLQLHITYNHTKGFAEVESMAFDISNGDLDFRSTLVNVEKYNLPLTFGESIRDNFLETIACVGVNHEVEKEFAFIQRTEDEDMLVEEEESGQDEANVSTAQYPKERVYLHLDNTGYFKGETIWFKAYVVRTDTRQRTNLSHVLYVELLNPSGDVVERRKLPIKRGEAYGDIKVDSVMTTGFYEIRAYTRYMTNWGTNACFSKVIPVFKAPKEEGDYSHPTIDRLSYRHRLPDGRKEVEDNWSVSLPVGEDSLSAPIVEDSVFITSATDYIKPCGKVELTIHAKPHSTLSLSVMDAATTVNGRRGNIRDWMMQPTDTADLAPLYSKVQPIESRLNIYGRVTSRQKNHTVDDVALTAFLYNKQGQSMSGTVKTDSTGQYMFVLPDINGEWDLQLLSKKADVAENYTIGIDRHFSPESRKLLPEECEMIPVDTTKIWHWMVDDEPVQLATRDRVLQEVKVKARRRWTDTSVWAHEQNARSVSNVYYDCDEDADRYADEGEQMPTLAEWLKTKNDLFDGEDSPNDVLLMKPRDVLLKRQKDFIGGPDYTGSRDLAPRDTVMPYEDWLSEEVNPEGQMSDIIGYDINTPARWKKFYRDGLSYKNRPVVWVVDNQYVGITSWRLRGQYFEPWKMVSQAIDLLYCDNMTNTGSIPSFLDEMKSVYISEDLEALHRHIRCDELDRMNPVVLYCFSHRKFKNDVKGLRSTHFQGFDEPSTFPMEDYSVIPPMEDYRRTIYWNPRVVTNAEGRAKVEFYNNSSCTDMYISVEGLSADGKFLVNE